MKFKCPKDVKGINIAGEEYVAIGDVIEIPDNWKVLALSQGFTAIEDKPVVKNDATFN